MGTSAVLTALNAEVETGVRTSSSRVKPGAAKYTAPLLPSVTQSRCTPLASAVAASAMGSAAMSCISSSFTCSTSQQRHQAAASAIGSGMRSPVGSTPSSLECRSQ